MNHSQAPASAASAAAAPSVIPPAISDASCQNASGYIWMRRSRAGSSRQKSLVKAISWNRLQKRSKPSASASRPTASAAVAPAPTAASVCFASCRDERSPDHSTAAPA